MIYSVQMGTSKNPDCPVFCQKPARFLKWRFLCFRNPPLKSETCARFQNPDCLWPKRFLESKNNSLNTTGYAKAQKPDLPPPKGVGDLPAKRGRITTYPWASFWDPSLGPSPNPTTATRSAKNMIAVVFHPSNQPKKETTHG